MSKVTDHQIHIEQLEMFVRVGATENERQSPQRLTANITLWPECDLGQLEDRIERTIDYSAVCDETKKFAGNRANHLIETLANGIAAHLLESFPIRAATVEVRKFVLPEAEYASVTVTRASVTG
jgi:dihydroneopterin aldolase